MHKLLLLFNKGQAELKLIGDQISLFLYSLDE